MFLKDFTIQSEKVSLVAPVYFTHDHQDSKLYAPFIDACPSIDKYLVSVDSELSKNQNFILYYVDFNNNQSDGNEWVFLEEGFKRYVYEKSGEWIRGINRIKLIDLNDKCKIPGSTELGMGGAYAADKNLENVNPETGMHGFVAYKGRQYIYDINVVPKVNILSLIQFDQEKRFKFNTICNYRVNN